MAIQTTFHGLTYATLRDNMIESFQNDSFPIFQSHDVTVQYRKGAPVLKDGKAYVAKHDSGPAIFDLADWFSFDSVATLSEAPLNGKNYLRKNGGWYDSAKVTDPIVANVESAHTRIDATWARANLAKDEAESAQTTADSGVAKADAAQLSATAAQSKADEAATAGYLGIAKADSAQLSANSAQSTADTASTAANLGVAKADSAQLSANTAQSTADAAKTTADTNAAAITTNHEYTDGAYTAANSASDRANTARINAHDAQQVADAAQATANTGVTKADAAQAKADAVSIRAEYAHERVTDTWEKAVNNENRLNVLSTSVTVATFSYWTGSMRLIRDGNTVTCTGITKMLGGGDLMLQIPYHYQPAQQHTYYIARATTNVGQLFLEASSSTVATNWQKNAIYISGHGPAGSNSTEYVVNMQWECTQPHV